MPGVLSRSLLRWRLFGFGVYAVSSGVHRDGAEFSYYGLMHRAGSLFDESAFVEGENAIVDFKYSASPKVTWWFDHHQSAFLTPEDQQDFLLRKASAGRAARRREGGGGQFYDADYVSCTGLIADVGREMYGFDTAPFAELIHWADIVDGAKYESAEAAVGMAAPAMKLTMVIESVQGEAFVPQGDSAADGDESAGGAGSAVCAGGAWAADGAAPGGD